MITIHRETFLNAITPVVDIIEEDSGPFSELKFENNRVSGCNPYVSANALCEAEFSGSVPARLFRNILATLKEPHVELEINGRSISITCGDHKSKLSFSPKGSSSYLHEPIDVTKLGETPIAPKGIKTGINLCLATTAKNREDLNGLYFSNSGIMSSDGLRLSEFHLDGEIKEPFWIKRESIKYLKKKPDPTNLLVTSKVVHFIYDAGKVILSFKRINDPFPAPNFQLGKDMLSELIEVSSFIDQATRVCKFVQALNSDSTMENNLIIGFEQNRLVFCFEGVINQIFEAVAYSKQPWIADMVGKKIQIKPTWLLEGMDGSEVKFSVVPTNAKNYTLAVFVSQDGHYTQYVTTKNG